MTNNIATSQCEFDDSLELEESDMMDMDEGVKLPHKVQLLGGHTNSQVNSVGFKFKTTEIEGN